MFSFGFSALIPLVTSLSMNIIHFEICILNILLSLTSSVITSQIVLYSQINFSFSLCLVLNIDFDNYVVYFIFSFMQNSNSNNNYDIPRSLQIICYISSGWKYSFYAYSAEQFFKNCLISFILPVTCIIRKYPTFYYAYYGPHFRSYRKSIIFEWKDNANNTFFFKSSLIY